MIELPWQMAIAGKIYLPIGEVATMADADLRQKIVEAAKEAIEAQGNNVEVTTAAFRSGEQIPNQQ